MKNSIFYGIVGIIVGVIIGASSFSSSPKEVAQAISPVGSTQSTAKVFSINMSPATASATSTSMLNSDASDRIVTDTFVDCNTTGTSLTYLTGAGLLAWSAQIATTSASGVGLQGNINYVGNLSISTSTVDAYTASSTNPAPNPVGRVWPSGSYMTFVFNATNTAACVIGGHYLAS